MIPISCCDGDCCCAAHAGDNQATVLDIGGAGCGCGNRLLCHPEWGNRGLGWPDLLLFAAVLAAAIGYAESGLLARELGAWQTTCWALVLSLPIITILTGISLRNGMPAGGIEEWSAFACLALVSMFLAFFAWYRGLALGPMSSVSQIQLIQPVLSICWAALILGEHITIATALGGVAAVACAAFAVRVRNVPTRAPAPVRIREPSNTE